MPDSAKSAAMAAQRRRDTDLELEVRRELHRRGLRYRLQQRIVPGAPRRSVDIVFPRARVVVDCRSCWWHGCPDHTAEAKRNRAWWAAKLAENRDRDLDTERRLVEAGWLVIVAWQHNVPSQVADWVAAAVAARGGSEPFKIADEQAVMPEHIGDLGSDDGEKAPDTGTA